MPDRLLTARAGEKLCVLGNEATVRGALEAGVRFVSGYPGTPASEIGDTFARIHGKAGVEFEWSVNEKIALETAFGAALMGARSLCYMKHLGLAYAGDPLGTIPYVGVDAGMVIVSAADPGMVVSPNEQDQRHLARMNRIPVLEPATTEDARAMTRWAFKLSEQIGLPVILRTTPRVAHTRGLCTTEEIPDRGERPVFRRRPRELTPVPANARRMRIELDRRIERCEEMLAGSEWFPVTGDGKLGVLAAGAVVPLVLDQFHELDLAGKVRVLCAGATHPFPRAVIESFLGSVDKVLVIEELSPFLEDEILAAAHRLHPGMEVLGKRTGHFPARFGYDHEMIAAALASYAGIDRETPAAVEAPDLPVRPPVLCPGCPHRGSYLAVKTVFGDDAVYFNDIGCYTLGYGPPLESVDTLLSMGSSIAMAAAAARVLGRKTLAFIGDSTFFHSGMPALLNAKESGDDVVVVVLDNRITGMTGHQPSPSTPLPCGDGDSRRPAPEAVARALGIEQVSVVDPNDLRGAVETFLEAKKASGLSVVVARRDCAIVKFREEGAAPFRRRFTVDADRCRHCGHEGEDLHCGQGPVKGHERAMVLRRILDQTDEPTPTPVELEAPCSAACPTNICVSGYVGRIAGGRYAEALDLIRRRNPLPVVSSRICHRPCEKVCVRADRDGPVAVNDLKRWLVDWEMAEGGGGAGMETGEPTGKRVAVVGAGPSGLSCAHELRRRGHGVVLLDEHDSPGGIMAQAIPEHRLPREVLTYETDWILGHGIAFRGGVRIGRDSTIGGLLDRYDAVYLGIGAMEGIGLGVNGEDLPGNLLALDLLRSHHRGEETGVEGKRSVVIGGGDAALDAARMLVRLGAASVRIVYRRSREEMPAHVEEVDAAEDEGVVLHTRMAPVAVLGEGRVEGLRVVRTEPGAPDRSGRRRPVNVPGTEIDIETDLVVSAVGQRPDLSCIDLELARERDGSVKVDPETGAGSVPGVFAGGDLTPGWKTVVNAVADGRRAAYGIDLYLAEEGRVVKPAEFVDPSTLRFYQPRNLHPEPAYSASLRPASERKRDHDDVVVPMTEEEVREEAARCLLCSMCSSCSACTDLFGCPAFREVNGRMVIDEMLCSGCGVCVSFCPNGAIHEVTG